MSGKTIKRWITINGNHVPIYEDGTLGGIGQKIMSNDGTEHTTHAERATGNSLQNLQKNLRDNYGLEIDSADARDIDLDNGQKVIMYDDDDNEYEGTYNRYSDGGREIVNIKKKETVEKDNKRSQKEGSGSSVHDFQKSIRNATSKEELSSIMKDAGNAGLSKESMDKVVSSAYDKAQEINSSKSKTGPLAHMTDDQVMEAALKGDENSINEMSIRGLSTTKDLQDYKKRKFVNADTTEYEGQKAPGFVPRVEGDGNQVVKIGEQEYHTEPLHGGYNNEHPGDYIEGHTYVPHITDINSDAKSFFVDNDGNIWHDGSQYLNSKSQRQASSIKVGDKELEEAYKKGQVAPEDLRSVGYTDKDLAELSKAGRDEALKRVEEGRNKSTVIDPMGNLVTQKTKSAYEKNYGEDFRSMSKSQARKERTGGVEVSDSARAQFSDKSDDELLNISRNAYKYKFSREESKAINDELKSRGYDYINGGWKKNRQVDKSIKVGDKEVKASPSKESARITKGVENARRQLDFDRPGDYAEISNRHWGKTLGVSNERMAEMMSVQDPKYDYEYQKETETKKAFGQNVTVEHHRMYRVPKGNSGITMSTSQIQTMIKNIRSGKSDSQYSIAELEAELRRRKK